MAALNKQRRNTWMYSPKRHMDVLERPQSDVPASLAVVFKAPVRADNTFFFC
ncbi:MAG: hypothetical protein GY694_06380 [Gammaproteobacteria bacterium]|nr:hypothetical protein [Gammaproteobacteria bacterium]